MKLIFFITKLNFMNRFLRTLEIVRYLKKFIQKSIKITLLKAILQKILFLWQWYRNKCCHQLQFWTYFYKERLFLVWKEILFWLVYDFGCVHLIWKVMLKFQACNELESNCLKQRLNLDLKRSILCYQLFFNLHNLMPSIAIFQN